MINYGAMFSAKPQFARPYSAAYTKRRTNAEWYISPLYFPPLARGAWFRIAPLARKRCSEILPLIVNRVHSLSYLYIRKRRENFYLLRYWRALRLLALNCRNIPFWRRRIRQLRPDNAASRLFRLSARPWRNIAADYLLTKKAQRVSPKKIIPQLPLFCSHIFPQISGIIQQTAVVLPTHNLIRTPCGRARLCTAGCGICPHSPGRSPRRTRRECRNRRSRP